MISIRKSAERGHADHGWLDSHHTFSFADYYDPAHMSFRSLRVINEDRVAAGGGFPTHPHRDMEIITYIVSGALQHRDSMGHEAVMQAGDVQRISAGTGIEHSEFNHSSAEAVHLLQIWIVPDRRGATPGYAEKSFGDGVLQLVASQTGRDGSIAINQDADLWLGKFGADAVVERVLEAGRGAWVQVFAGALSVNGRELAAGDAAAIEDERALSLATKAGGQFLLFDMK